VSAGRSFDLVHPHAPGTREHDPAELDALLHPSSAVQPGRVADVYAVKGAIGHGLGASGLASVVVSALTLAAGRRPPMPWLTQPMKRPDGRRLETDANARACSRTGSQAVLAAGFGGHLAAAVLRGRGKHPLPT
jgi:3-oxoacyl-(acyl-carrier-protein) synthase